MTDSPFKKNVPLPLLGCDPLTGIVTSIFETEIDRSDPSIFVVAAETGDMAAYGLASTGPVTGSGAGLTAPDAYAAAIGESLERYAASFIHPEDLVYASSRELRRQGYAVVGPGRWALYDPSQYERLPYAPFLEDAPIAWVRAESLTHRAERWIPACLVYLSHIHGGEAYGARDIAPAISTGTACARSRAEALVKGICEVVERDAFTIMWRNRLSRPRVRIDPRSILSATFEERFARPGLEYCLVSTTLDLLIPSFFGFVRDTRRDPPAIVVGGAAHPDPVMGALKTLLELGQGLTWIERLDPAPSAQMPDFDNVRSFTDRVLLYSGNDMYEAFQFLTESEDEVDLSSIPVFDSGTLSIDLQRYYAMLAAKEMEVIALDLTTADLQDCGVSVVKTFIPACEPMEADHRFPFLGGRRWREAPLRLGLSSVASTLQTINPYPHPYP